MAASELAVRTEVRRVLARHWVDLQHVRFGAYRGTVRFTGELHRRSDDAAGPLDATALQAIEEEVRRIREVRQVHFELKNWERDSSGRWTPRTSRGTDCSIRQPLVERTDEAA